MVMAKKQIWVKIFWVISKNWVLALAPKARLPGPKTPKTYPIYGITNKNQKSRTFKFFLKSKLEDANSYLAQLPSKLWSCKVARK